MSKMIVDLNWLRMVEKRRLEIDAHPLEDIEWIEDGQVIQLNPEYAKHYRFMGLGNAYLANMTVLTGLLDENGDTIPVWIRPNTTEPTDTTERDTLSSPREQAESGGDDKRACELTMVAVVAMLEFADQKVRAEALTKLQELVDSYKK